jgi:predicted outer membrane repeat protein
MQVTPATGTLEEQITELHIQINPVDLSGGDYRASLVVNGAGAVNSPQTIRVELGLRGTLHVPGRYATLQAAIDAARDGDTVLVADGVYRGHGNRDLKLNGKAIHLKSVNGPAHCIIDVEGSEEDPHRAFVCHYTQETNNTIVEGFTLTGGDVGVDFFKIFPPFDGGAIWCGGSRPVFRDCIIKNNTAFSVGGGGYFIALFDEWAEYTQIDHCILSGNEAQGNLGVFTGGGGVWIQDQVQISNALIMHNYSGGSGGAVSLFGLNQTITNTTITENEARISGGGIYVWDAYQDPTRQLPDFEINNSILSGNSAVSGHQLSCDYVGQNGPPRAGISFSNIPNEGNDLELHPDIEWVGQGPLNHADPLFEDPEHGDYRLSPFSPLIDRGSNDLVKFTSIDLDGNPRFLDADYDGLPQVDLGPYEFVPEIFDGPLIEISGWEFDFTAYQGEENPPPETFSLRNSGTGSLQWQITNDCPWLIVSPVQGTAGGESADVTVQPIISGLQRGRYSCEIAIESPEAANSPRTFTVTLQVFERGTLHVPEEFETIQQAINFAEDGDRIIITPGTYTENLYWAGKNITLRSEDPNDWDTVSGTILSGGQKGPVVTFAGTEVSAKLLGFTLADGFSEDTGGGIQGNGTTATIERCVVRNNISGMSGGGIHGALGRIANCIIQNNTAELGGGLADCNDITNCIITSNTAVEGGGLYAVNGSLIHSTIADNTADKGAGLSRCTGLIRNSIIWGNQLDPLYQSSVPSYSCIQGDPRGEGNIDTDPEFIDPASGDYRLAFGSFCIDAADPNAVFSVKADIDGHVRPFDGNNDGTLLPDMGAYEMPLSDQVVIGISQHEFIFTDLEPEPLTFTIWNAGLPAVNYTIAEPDCSWLSISPTTGTVFNAPEIITLTVDTTDVPAGAYTCQLVISDPAAVNSPRTVNVQLTLFQDEIHLTPAGPTIQHALTYVTEGGTLLLADGVYTGPGNREIDFLGRHATIKSINGPENCILDLAADPNTPARAFLFRNNEGADSVIEGLTLLNGYSNQSGGAVFCDNTSPTIKNCIFKNNQSAEDGGAVYAQYGGPALNHCRFEGSAADRGGAVGARQSNITVFECDFSFNNSTQRGGAIYAEAGTVTVLNCIFTNNEADDGGALFSYQAAGSLMHCVFENNAATLEDWFHGGGALFNLNSDLVIEDCRFIGNTGAWDGGAIENWSSSPALTRCEFIDNQALGNDGGAVFNIFDSDPVISQCSFIGNRAASWGGAMRNRQSSPRIDNSLFVENDAVDNGGAIFNFLRSNPSVSHCTFTRNSANGHEGGAMYSLNECGPTVTNSIFWDNESPQVFDTEAETAISYSTVDWPGAGNNTLPPEFVDPNHNDFRLKRTSPCIDTGKDVPLAIDLGGNPRPWDCPWSGNASSGYDRGAFEFSAVQASLKITPAAINVNSRGKDARAVLVFPSGIGIDAIDPEADVMLMSETFAVSVEATRFYTKKSFLVMDMPLEREILGAYFTETEKAALSVTGLLKDGRTFYGTDRVRIITK